MKKILPIIMIGIGILTAFGGIIYIVSQIIGLEQMEKAALMIPETEMVTDLSEFTTETAERVPETDTVTEAENVTDTVAGTEETATEEESETESETESQTESETAENTSEEETEEATSEEVTSETEIEDMAVGYVLPCIRIDTENAEEIDSKEEYVSSTITVFNCEEKYRMSAPGGVRVRGNSTADGENKPYRIHFDEKQKMLGLHDNRSYKNWVLLRTPFLLNPDYMTFRLAETIFEGKYYVSDATFVQVYVNDEYKGLYLLCEQNHVEKGRISMKETGPEDAPDEIGYFIELDNYGPEEKYWFEMTYDYALVADMEGTERRFWKDYYTVRNIASEEQKEFAEKYIKNLWTILFEAVENDNPMMFDGNYELVSAEGVYTCEEALEAVFDMESVVNMLILEELAHNYDLGNGSFFMAIDFSRGSNYRKMTFLAPWDFSWGYQEDPKERYFASTWQYSSLEDDCTSNWLMMFMKEDWFRQKVRDKWNRLEETQQLEKTCEQVRRDTQALAADLGEDSSKLQGGMNVCDFVDRRIEWLTEQWREDDGRDVEGTEGISGGDEAI